MIRLLVTTWQTSIRYISHVASFSCIQDTRVSHRETYNLARKKLYSFTPTKNVIEVLAVAVTVIGWVLPIVLIFHAVQSGQPVQPSHSEYKISISELCRAQCSSVSMGRVTAPSKRITNGKKTLTYNISRIQMCSNALRAEDIFPLTCHRLLLNY